MHPIEHLRYVARAGGLDPVGLVAEAGHALGGFVEDPAALVAAARRLVARHPGVGPLWWLCSRVLVAPDPSRELVESVAALEDDPTAAALRDAIPGEASVLVVGWPATAVTAIARRGDLEVRAVDDGSGVDLGRALGRIDLDVVAVAVEGLGAAAAASDLVVVEALAAGPGSALCAPGSLAAAAVGHTRGRTVWLVAAAGRALPGPLYDACASASLDGDEPWESGLDTVPLDLCDRVVGPTGPVDPALGAVPVDCPVATELLRPARTPGSHHP